jgi:polysaccharide biosynthesis/export protein
MSKIRLFTYGILSIFLLHGCSQILEPVSFDGSPERKVQEKQEDFSINIKSLTFSSAKKANNDPYHRKLMRLGSGSQAKVVDEIKFLDSSIPKNTNTFEYIIGVGDELSFIQLIEFSDVASDWPEMSPHPKYLLGIGDVLQFTQIDTRTQNINLQNFKTGVTSNDVINNLTISDGVIGSDGNILLLGLGSINAANRTITEIRTEVRNILIRNGINPSFQLEIKRFNSKKAYITSSNGESKTITVTNLPITLRELVLGAGISQSTDNLAIISLTRDTKEYRITAKQLFNISTQDVHIKDNDQIEIQIVSKNSIKTKSKVGSKGNILLPSIGSVVAANRTLSELQLEVSSLISQKGIMPNFQLEISEFSSKKAFFIQKNLRSTIIPLTDKNLTLRELILSSSDLTNSDKGLVVITLLRNGKKYRMSAEKIFDPSTENIWIQDEDQIELENLLYKPGQVFALSGTGSAQITNIDPSNRETLADILFVQGGTLNNINAQRSEVYLLRGQNPSVAYHLDAQNVSRLLVAANTELRPNDIVFVAERPIISFARTLAEIFPLRVLLRDIQDNNIP